MGKKVNEEGQRVLDELIIMRDGLSVSIRILRETLRRLERQEKATKMAKGTPAYAQVQKSEARMKRSAQDLISSLSSTESGKVGALLSPDEDFSEEGESETGERSQGSVARVPRWSHIAKKILESAFAQESFPQDWNKLMSVAFGPEWESMRLSALPPGRWGSKGERTLKEDLQASDSVIRSTVTKALGTLLAYHFDHVPPIPMNADMAKANQQFLDLVSAERFRVLKLVQTPLSTT